MHRVRITYKSCALVYSLHGSAPRYLQELIQPVAEVTSRRRRLRSSSSSALLAPLTPGTTLVTERLPSLHGLVLGITY